MTNFEDLLGKTLTKIERLGDEELHFYTEMPAFQNVSYPRLL